MKKPMIVMILSGIMLLLWGALLAQETNPVTGVEIIPNPVDKFCRIIINTNVPTNLGINVETETGIVIKTLYWGEANGVLELTWNRLDDNGLYVAPGTYLLVVNYAARYTSLKKTLILK